MFSFSMIVARLGTETLSDPKSSRERGKDVRDVGIQPLSESASVIWLGGGARHASSGCDEDEDGAMRAG